MPIGNILRFFAARAIPAGFGFLALMIFTRLLSPAEFGTYSVALAGANVATAALFYWLALSAVRFGIDSEPARQSYLTTILLLYLICVAAVIVLMVAVAVLARQMLAPVWWAAAGFVLAESWFQLNQKLAIARVEPRRFAVMGSTKVLVGLAIGSVAALLGFGAAGVLSGLVLGSLMAGFSPALLREWRAVPLFDTPASHRSDVLRYGLPLGITVALGYLLGTVDRALLSIHHGTAQAGEYAAGYDLAYAALTLSLTTINIVGYPYILNAPENDPAELRRRFKASLDMLLIVSLPVFIVLVAYAPNATSVFLGSEFAEPAGRVVPWVAMATLLGGIRSYYLDITFHLQRDTRTLLGIVTAVASVNLIINLLLIERWGIQGALLAVISANAVGFVMSALLGRRHVHRAPAPDRETLKIIAAACLAGSAAWLASNFRGATWLGAQLLLVGLCYCAMLAVLRAQIFVDFWKLVGRQLRVFRHGGQSI